MMLSQTKHWPKYILLYQSTSFFNMSYNINFFGVQTVFTYLRKQAKIVTIAKLYKPLQSPAMF